MWFRKTKTEDKGHPYPGTERALDGHAAAYTVETMASEAIVVESVPELAEIVEALRGLAISSAPLVRDEASLHALAGLTSGYTLSGLRAAAMVSSLSRILDSLHAAAGKRLPFVVHLTCRAPHGQAGALGGGHGDYFGAAGTGCFQLFAKSAQEVADFTLIAHRVAEISLTPGICAQDLFRTSHSVRNIQLPDIDLIRRYLGSAGDVIEAPTPSQQIVFGTERRRVPVIVDRDRPVGTGGVQDEDSYFKALAGQRPFFAGHLDEIIDRAMQEFGELTGRFYAKVTGYRTDDAEHVIVAQGAVAEELEAVADYLRTSAKVKVGVVNVTALRPFPGAQLTRILKGKKAVTVLERADEPLAEDLPLAREVRSAIDKATENATSNGGDAAWPSYETYQRPTDRPRVFSGVYGVGAEAPSFNDLLSVFKNMLPDGARKRRFYVGINFEQPTRRFPHLQTLQQSLNRGYPGLGDLALPPATDTPFAEHPGRTVQLYSLEIQNGVYASNLFAQAWAGVFNGTVRTYPDGGLEPSLHANAVTIAYGDRDLSLKSGPGVADTLLVSSDHFLEDLPSRAVIKKGGTLIVGSRRKPEKLWRSLSRRAAEWIQSHELKFAIIDPMKVASETASMPSFVDQLGIWALFGAYLEMDPKLTADEAKLFIGDFQGRLEQFLGRTHYLLADLTKTMKRGTEEVAEVPWRTWTVAEWPAVAEKAPPWTVQAADHADGTVFDPKRFWHSVGYLYDTGETEQTLIDPYVATGIVPGASSAFRDMSSYRTRVPEWLPENCTGCGACWTYCPDSALPATIQSLPSLIGAAMSECQKAGTAMIQMERISEHLSKQAYRIIAKGDRSKYLRAGVLLRDAFEQLVGKMDLKPDQLEPMQAEFDKVCEVVDDFPVSRTALFFDDPNKNEKGSGVLLSIALNPLSCKACGLCVEVCPDDALAWAEQTPERLQSEQRKWNTLMALPEVPAELLGGFISPTEYGTQVNRLLDKTSYNSLVGGDGAFPGNGDKIAIHLAAATIESVMKPRFDAHVGRLSDLIQRVEDKIQGKVKRAVEINDFESFASQLGRLEGKVITADKLTEMVGAEGERTIDEAQLKRLAVLLGKLKEQRRLYMEGAGGGGRARMIMSIDASGSTFWSGTYPDNPHPYPWVSHLRGDAPALAEGVFEGVARQLADEVAVCRRAELELEDAYDAEKHEPAFAEFSWRSFNDAEWELIPPVMVVGRSGTTRWEDVAKLLRSRYPIRVLMINNDAVVMGNAGTGERGESALGSENNFGYLALSRGDVFVLQSSVGNPGHFMSGVAEGLTLRGPAFFHVYAPNPRTSGLAADKGAEDARLAYESRAFPLFKASPEEKGASVDLDGNPAPGRDWTEEQMTVRDASGVVSTLEAPLTVASWAVREGRFQHHFNIVAKGQLNDEMKPLAEFIELEPQERDGVQPYIHLVDDHGRHVVAIVSADLARVSEASREFWNVLQRASTPLAAAPRDEVSEAESRAAEPAATAVVDQAIHQQLTERLLWLSGYSRDPEFFKQSLREFVHKRRETSPGGNEG